jgi:tetratricopeptide (TPR) repeat protein
MATAIAKSYDVVALEDIEPGPEHDGRIPLNIRRHFDIRGFGVRANRSVGDGHVVGEHTEDGLGTTGQEELYLVLSGKATFNVDGEPIYATAGTMVFVRDPAAKRSAVAKEEGTTILAIGGTPGRAYELSVGEAMNDMWEPYRAEDFEGALEALQPVLEERPEALVLFNVACMEARLGRTDDAIVHLEQAIADDDRIKENIRTDGDLDSLREDPRFQALTA